MAASRKYRTFPNASTSPQLEGICAPGAIRLSEDAYRQVKGGSILPSGRELNVRYVLEGSVQRGGN